MEHNSAGWMAHDRVLLYNMGHCIDDLAYSAYFQRGHANFFGPKIKAN